MNKVRFIKQGRFSSICNHGLSCTNRNNGSGYCWMHHDQYWARRDFLAKVYSKIGKIFAALLPVLVRAACWAFYIKSREIKQPLGELTHRSPHKLGIYK
jgi:hypothetical protein